MIFTIQSILINFPTFCKLYVSATKGDGVLCLFSIFSQCSCAVVSSTSHPVVELVFAEIASTSQTIRTSLFTMFALVWSSDRFLNAKTHILGVELRLTGLTSTSRSIRTTCAKSFALLRSSDSVLSVRSRILVIPLQVDS